MSIQRNRASSPAGASAPRIGRLIAHRDRHRRRRLVRRRLVRARRQPAPAFDNLFTQHQRERSTSRSAPSLAFGEADDISTRDPVPAALVDTVAAVAGVERRRGQHPALRPDHRQRRRRRRHRGAPTLGVRRGTATADDVIELREGAAPDGPDEVAIDKATAERRGPRGRRPDRRDHRHRAAHRSRSSALVGLGDTDGFGGATFAAVGPGDRRRGARRRRRVRRDRHPGRRRRRRRRPCNRRIEEVLPAKHRGRRPRDARRREQRPSVGEFISAFGTGLLIFAFITAFVSAFLINNVFQITIGQRLRELALLRAVGGAGRQVRRLIVRRGARDVGRSPP